MTFVCRNLRPTETITKASGMLREGREPEALELLTFALRTESESPDLYWLRGRAHWNLAFRDDDPERYRWALQDFAGAVELDPSPILEHDVYFWPQHEWALPAYKKLLSHPNWEVRLRAAHTISLIGQEIPGLVEALLDAIRAEGFVASRSFSPVRRALRALGWPYSDQNGDVLISQDDLENQSPRPESPDPDPSRTERCAPVWEMLNDRNLYDSEADYEERSRGVEEEIDLDGPTLESRLNDPDTLARARAVAILATRKPPDLFEKLAPCVKDRHRLVRTLALRAVGPVAAAGEPTGRAVACLLEAAQKDRAYPCRSAAVEAIGRVIQGAGPAGAQSSLRPLLDVLAAKLSDEDRGVVERAVVAIGHAGGSASHLLAAVDAIDFIALGGLGLGIAECICEKAKTVFLISRIGEPLRVKNWEAVTTILALANPLFRMAALERIGTLVRLEPSILPSAVKLLLERAMMDDSKTVRRLAADVLSGFPVNPLRGTPVR